MADVNYARIAYKQARHHERFVRRVEATDRKLICQDCSGRGGAINAIFMNQGPWEECGWCEGTGYVTPWIRSAWLRYRRQIKPRLSI